MQHCLGATNLPQFVTHRPRISPSALLEIRLRGTSSTTIFTSCASHVQRLIISPRTVGTRVLLGMSQLGRLTRDASYTHTIIYTALWLKAQSSHASFESILPRTQTKAAQSC